MGNVLRANFGNNIDDETPVTRADILEDFLARHAAIRDIGSAGLLGSLGSPHLYTLLEETNLRLKQTTE